MQTPGSFKSLMDGLYTAQSHVAAHSALAQLEPLTNYRWRSEAPDLPALWNTLGDGSTEQRDLHRVRDSFVIETRIGVRFTDDQDRLGQVELYFDAYRDTVDPYFRPQLGQTGHAPTLQGDATWAIRTRFRSFSESFGGAVAFGIAVLQDFWLDHPL